MNKINQLTEIHQSGKPYIIYKSEKGFDLYTDFSKKIILSKKNIKSFLSKKNKRNLKDTDLFIGFFGYELLNNLIDVVSIGNWLSHSLHFGFSGHRSHGRIPAEILERLLLDEEQLDDFKQEII